LRDQLSLQPRVIIPMHIADHWVLAILTLSDHPQAVLYDSLATDVHKKLANDQLNEFTTRFLGQSIDVISGDCPQQVNAADCGVFAFAIACHVLADVPLPQTLDSDLWRSLMCYLSADRGSWPLSPPEYS
ncbi:hypothetical protein F5883DRAFT_383537, partial [Diaporthe sp. PMI_573]